MSKSRGANTTRAQMFSPSLSIRSGFLRRLSVYDEGLPGVQLQTKRHKKHKLASFVGVDTCDLLIVASISQT